MNEKSEQAKSKVALENIKSVYFLPKIFEIMKKRRTLEIIKCNKKLQKLLNISINDYKEYPLIEIELKLDDNGYGKFINITDEEKEYYHIYFDNSKEEIKRNYTEENEKVNIIKIIIDHQVTSFENLFCLCEGISSINFKKFYRSNITNMKCMFFECKSLKELNLSNFNTDNVNDMSYMFQGCKLLKQLNLNSFNTNNVTNMSWMFCDCDSLVELNISNFNTNNVTNMEGIFYRCSSLKELNFSNFNTNNTTNINHMFLECSDELKNKIREQFKNIRLNIKID